MTTWFAQNSSVNIDSVNQWNDDPAGAGSWLTWASLGSADVLVANGKTSISINVDVICDLLTTSNAYGGTVGGNFLPVDGVTITANLQAGESSGAHVLICSGGTISVIGDLTSAILNTSANCINVASATTINVVGNVSGPDTAGTNGSNCIELGYTASELNIIGDLRSGKIGGSSGNHSAVYATGAAIIFVTGDAYGLGTGGGNACGIRCTGASSIRVVGNVFGANTGSIRTESCGILSTNSSGFVSLSGNVLPGAASPAVYVSAGKLILECDLLASSNARPSVLVGAAVTVLINESTTMKHEYRGDLMGAIGAIRTLYTGGVNLGHPVESNVRDATTFGLSNEYTGSLKVPDPAYVSAGVLTDNTVGTLAAITASDLTTAMASYISPPTGSPVERSPNDANPIAFDWPVSGATITAEVSINNASYVATVGTVTFLRTEGSNHYYTLSFDAADRPAAEGTSRYKFADGTYTQYTVLRVEGASTDAAGIRSAVGLTSANLDSQLNTIIDDTGTAIPALLPAALVGGRMDSNVGAMANDTLTAAAIAADAGAELAALVETYIVNDADSTAVMQALADKIAADWIVSDASPTAIAAAVWTAGTRALTEKTGFTLSQAFPTNFEELAINASGHISQVTLVDTTTLNTDMVSVASLASQASVDVIDGIVDNILVDTNDLQLNQGSWLTASGFSTHSDSDVWDVGTRALTTTGLDAISEWTVDVMGSLSGNVGGIAGTINTLDALNNSIPSGVVTQLNNTTYDGVLYTDAITTLLSMAQGRINESNSGVFEFYSQDNNTLLYTLTKSGNERLRT